MSIPCLASSGRQLAEEALQNEALAMNAHTIAITVILNMADKGFKVCAYNRTTSKVDDFLNNEAKGELFDQFSLENG